MKELRKYIKNVLSEASGYMMENFYHGSPYEFDKFDISRVGTGDARSKFGWGLYFTTSPNTALQYAKDLSIGQNRAGGFNIYEVKLIGLDSFLVWDEQIPQEVYHRVYNALIKAGKEQDAEQLKTENEEYEMWTMDSLYQWLEVVTGSNKGASEFLFNHCGVNGVIGETGWLEGKVYVAFSDQVVKILSHSKSGEFEEPLDESEDSDLDRYTIDDNFYLYKDGRSEFLSNSKRDLIDYLTKRKPELLKKFGFEPEERYKKITSNKKLKPKPLSAKIFSQAEMVQMGANYHLQHGMLMMIPVDMIDGLDPEPGTWSDESGEERNFTSGQKIAKPIEVHWDEAQGAYILWDGNHRVLQAKINGDKYIKAFVQADSKEIYNGWKMLIKGGNSLNESEMIDEDYESVKLMKDLSNDILIHAAKANLEYVLRQLNESDSEIHFYPVRLLDVYQENPRKYAKIQDFLINSNVSIQFSRIRGKLPLDKLGSYSWFNDTEYDTSRYRSIYLRYNDEIAGELNKKRNEYSDFGYSEIYFTFYYKFESTLEHELQHAYDDYRSKSKIFRNKKSEKFYSAGGLKKIDDPIKAGKNYKKYSNLQEEVWARFTQAINKARFSTIEFKETPEGKSYLFHKMYPLPEALKNFRYEFGHWRLLPEKMQIKLMRKASQFWHKEKDELPERNRIEIEKLKEPESELAEVRKFIKNTLAEQFNIVHNTLQITEPYDNIKKINIGGRNVYILFGDVDYYENKQSILAIKRKPSEIKLDQKSYQNFLREFAKRFNSLGESKTADSVISIETTSPVTSEMANTLHLPFVKDGFKKNVQSFKMKDIDLKDRNKIKDLFSLNFNMEGRRVICVMDDFITSGTTFKNAFDKLPAGVEAFGICLFKLNS